MEVNTATGDRRVSSRAAYGGLFAAMLGIAAVQLAAFWPGIMVWDAIRQYGQALSGRYDDWHPPAMNWLWRQMLPLRDGPAPMLLVQMLLYWGGLTLLASSALQQRRLRLTILLVACALLPVPFVLVGTILKDSLMAGALLAVAGLIAWRRPGDRLLSAIAILLLLGAATLRFNALPACLPFLVRLLPADWKRTPGRLLLTILAAAIPLLAAMPLANRLLHAESSGVALSLIVYDLGGVTRNSGKDMFPPLAIADPVAVNARCYSPVSWDDYAWWGPDPCPIGFDSIRTALRTSGSDPYRIWAGAVATHPLAYAQHRLTHFNSNIRFLIRDGDDPRLSLQSDPNPWDFRLEPSALRKVIGDLASDSLLTPLGWPACWLALCLGILLLGPGLPRSSLALPIALSVLLYGFSYLPLSVASEVRYHLWTMIGTAVALPIALTDVAAAGGVTRRRLAIAFAPVAIVTLLCIGARLLL